jgi:hypothetical protein
VRVAVVMFMGGRDYAFPPARGACCGSRCCGAEYDRVRGTLEGLKAWEFELAQTHGH